MIKAIAGHILLIAIFAAFTAYWVKPILEIRPTPYTAEMVDA